MSHYLEEYFTSRVQKTSHRARATAAKIMHISSFPVQNDCLLY